jgi:hypothetical protein
MLNLVLRYRGDPNAHIDGTAWSALTIALVEDIEDLDRGRSGRSTDAVALSRFRRVNSLIQAGADVDLVHSGQTVMDEIMVRGEYGLARALLSRGYKRPIQLAYLYEIHERPETQGRKALRDDLQRLGIRFPVLKNYTSMASGLDNYPEFVPLAH